MFGVYYIDDVDEQLVEVDGRTSRRFFTVYKYEGDSGL